MEHLRSTRPHPGAVTGGKDDSREGLVQILPLRALEIIRGPVRAAVTAAGPLDGRIGLRRGAAERAARAYRPTFGLGEFWPKS